MIGFAILLAAAQPAGAVDAERSFAAAAQTEGQWAAFRRFATDDAVLFVPQAVNAGQWLRGRANPPVSVMWWPGRAFVSCDGTTAVTTGPWVRDGGRLRGYFTTVWLRQPEGSWKWQLDHGDVLDRPRPATDAPPVTRATCPRRPMPLLQIEEPPNGLSHGFRQSPDRTLSWTWVARPDGSRFLEVHLFDGRAVNVVLRDEVAAGR